MLLYLKSNIALYIKYKKGEPMLDLHNLSEKTQGIIFIIIGIVLLLHALGIVEKGTNLVIIGMAIYLIVIGSIKFDAYQN